MAHELNQAAERIIESFSRGGKLLLCGNGGSAADCGHIAGELCKGFLLPRPPGEDFAKQVGEPWARGLQRGLPALDLTAQTPLITAIVNDISGEDIFSQQVMAFGREGDVLLGISTSGNAENVRRAMAVARAMGLYTIAFTGAGGGRLGETVHLTVAVEAQATRDVQEKQIALYHDLCQVIEERMFGGE